MSAPRSAIPDAQPRPGRFRQLAVNLAVAMVTVIVLLATVELTLRLSGFSFLLYPEDIEFGAPDPVLMKSGFLGDDELLWVTKDYGAKLKALRRAAPTLLLLGDSCTHLGRYDLALVQQAQQRLGQSFAFGNLGVAGWSSYQGRRQVARDVPELRPKVVTLYFGWNDHWIGFGLEDKNVARVTRTFTSGWSRFRLAQLLTKGVVAWGARETAYPNRVSLEDFAGNLEAMAEDLRRIGAVPVVLTAPGNHRPGEEPAKLAERWLRDLGDLVPLHASYVDTARRVAQDTGTPLCDLASEFAALSDEERDRAFQADGIHLTAAGDRRLAGFLFDCFEREELWPLILSGSGG